LAIATGKISNLVVIDIDPRHKGDRTFNSLNRRRDGGICRLDRGLRCKTGGGGEHIYCRYPQDAEIKSRNGWRQGVDIKADGGYVIAPPSNHIAGEYSWTNTGKSPIHLPPKWIDALVKPAPTTTERPVAADSHSLLLQRAHQYAAKVPAAAEGGRNQGAFSLAGHLASLRTEHGENLGEPDLVAVVESWNARNKPPLDSLELKSCVASAIRNGTPRQVKEVNTTLTVPAAAHEEQDGGDKPERKSQATVLVELAAECELFHDADSEAFVRFPVGEDAAFHWEVSRVRNKCFRRWISRRYYKATEKTPSAQSLQDALGVIEAKSIFDGDRRSVFVRSAEYDGRIYVDLANERWQVVEIDKQGWRVLDDSPVIFRRSKSMLPLPVPVPGKLGDIRRFINVNNDDWPLLSGFMVQSIRPTGPYPVLAVHGEHGSAKSTLCRFVRKVIDPNVSPLRADYREPRDLMICANSGWVVALDNLSVVQPWLSDCLCRLSTGGGFTTRTLYENDEETIFDAKRPVILNCIEEVVTRSDLLDRCVLLNLPRIDGNKRVPEAQLDRDFDAALPGIVGGLLTAVSVAMRNESSVRLASLPRLADFAIWAAAAEPAMDLQPGEFIQAYTTSRAAGNESAIEASPVGKAVVEFVEHIVDWTGTSTQLLKALEARADDKTKSMKSWPGTARSLGAAIKRLAPNLREAGLKVEFERTGHKGTRTITLAAHKEHCETSSSAMSAMSVEEETRGFEATDADANADAQPVADANVSHQLSVVPRLFRGENQNADIADDADAKFLTNSNELEVIEI